MNWKWLPRPGRARQSSWKKP